MRFDEEDVPASAFRQRVAQCGYQPCLNSKGSLGWRQPSRRGRHPVKLLNTRLHSGILTLSTVTRLIGINLECNTPLP